MLENIGERNSRIFENWLKAQLNKPEFRGPPGPMGMRGEQGMPGVSGMSSERHGRRGIKAQLSAEQLKELLVMFPVPSGENFWHNPATDLVEFFSDNEYSEGAQYFFQYCLIMKLPFNEDQITTFAKEFVTAFRNLSL